MQTLLKHLALSFSLLIWTKNNAAFSKILQVILYILEWIQLLWLVVWNNKKQAKKPTCPYSVANVTEYLHFDSF